MRRLTLGSLALLAVLALAPAHASAHATLLDSQPASGSQLAAPPSAVVLHFDEPVDASLGGVRLRDGSGVEFRGVVVTQPQGHREVVTATLPNLSVRDAILIATYRVVSADGHPVSGSVILRIGHPSDATTAHASPHRSTVGIVYGLIRWLAYMSAMCLMAGTMGRWLGAPLSRRMWRSALALLTAAAFAQFAVAGPYLADGGWSDAVSPHRWGMLVDVWPARWWLIRGIAAGLAVAVGTWHHRRRDVHPSPIAPVLTSTLSWLLAATLLLSFVGDGHAAAGQHVLLGWVVTGLHLVAAGVWLGGLVAVTRLARAGNTSNALLDRWSAVAGAAVLAIVFTGVGQALRVDADLADTGNAYSRLFWLKVAGTLAMLCVAGVARRHLRRWRHDDENGRHGVRRAVLVELIIGIAVVIASTWIVQADPHTARPIAVTDTLRLADRTLTYQLDGTTVGRHRVALALDDHAAPLRDPLAVTARWSLSGTDLGTVPVVLHAKDQRTWVADAIEIPVAGAWKLEVLIDSPTAGTRFTTTISFTN